MKRLGLDIQPTVVNVIVLKKLRSSYCVICAESIQLPKNIMVNGQIKHWDILSLALENFVRANHLQGTPCALCLPTHLAIMQRMRIPKGLCDEDIFAEINAHLKDKFAWLREPLAIDFTQLSYGNDTDQDIHYVAMRESHLLPYCESIANCHLKLKIVDIDVYALKRVIQQFSSITISGNYAAIYYDHDHLLATYIIFNKTEVLSFENWDCANTNELNLQIHKRISQSDFGIHDVQHIFMCIDVKANIQVTNCMSYLPWVKHLTFSMPRLSEQFAKIGYRFLLACGMALCEMPLW